jgi:hypothetical protein
MRGWWRSSSCASKAGEGLHFRGGVIALHVVLVCSCSSRCLAVLPRLVRGCTSEEGLRQ